MYSLIPVMWSVGATMRFAFPLEVGSQLLNPPCSPFMGGVLANPAAKWPDTLGKIALLREHPYFLPCAVAACIALSSFAFAFIGLREVPLLHKIFNHRGSIMSRLCRLPSHESNRTKNGLLRRQIPFWGQEILFQCRMMHQLLFHPCVIS